MFAFVGHVAVAQTQTSTPQPTPSPAASPAQQSTSQDDGKLPTVRVRTDEVNVIFTVVDNDGRFVKDLKQEQFRILDNNLPPRDILKFEAQTNLPLRVGMLIDASNSIRDRFKFEQAAATDFLLETIRPKSDQAFIQAFDESPEVTQDFTSDLDKLRKGIKAIQPGGGTALWDAIYYACREKLLKQPETGSVRRAIILVSDGDDNQSRVLRKEAVKMAQRAEVIIYAISTSLVDTHEKGSDNLRALTEATGGRAFFPVKMDEVTQAFLEIQGELRSQYSVSYRPDQFEANGQFRPIQIVATSKKLHTRAKKGYYVPRR
jgi:VWFA-related protein